MVKIYTQHEADYYFAQQVTWGTAVTTNMRRLNCEPTVFDVKPIVRKPNRAYQGRIRPRAAHLVDYRGATPGATFRGVARREDLPFMIFSVVQDLVSQSGTTPNFLKTFKFPIVVPDFPTEGDGTPNRFFGTFLKTAPEASKGQEFHDAVGKQLKLSWKQGQGLETRMMYEWQVIGRGTPNLASTATGATATNAPEDHYDFYDINVATIEGVDMVILEGEILINPNVFPVSVDKANDGKIHGWGYGVPEVDFKLKVAWTSEAHDVQEVMGTEVDHSWVISFGTSPNAGFLEFNAEMQPGEDIADDEGGGQTKAIDLVGKLIRPAAITDANWPNAMSIVTAGLPDFTAFV